MVENLHKPEAWKSDEEKINDVVSRMTGPEYSGNAVAIDGHVVPNLRMHDRGDTIEFILADRLGYEFPREWAYLAAAFAANAMAIGAGHALITATHASNKPFGSPLIRLAEVTP